MQIVNLKLNFSFVFLFLSLLFVIFSCQNQSSNRIFIQILDKPAAEISICTDTIDNFFEYISILEMAIQLKTDTLNLKIEPLVKYKTFLKSEAQNFSKKEAKCADQQLQKALAYVLKINPNLALPDTIKLAKIAGKAYGAQTFFTRQNTIFIPQTALLEGEATTIYYTLIHEIFHLYSRYNQKNKKKLFAAIGFSNIEKIKLNKMLEKRIFYNPDAVNIAYSLQVQDQKGKKIKVVPIIFSRFSNYNSENSQFFQYLEFRLFEIKEENGNFYIAEEDTGQKPENMQGFFEQVGRNTSYIIHPEEILADNFKLLALQKAAEKHNLVDITNQGQELLLKIEKILLE